MKGLVYAKVAGLFLAAALLAGCYAPITNPNGYLNLNLQFAGVKAAGNEVIGLVVNGDAEDSFREMLWLIDKGENAPGGLSSSEADRLVEIGQQMATSGLVKFGGFPFFQTTINPSPGHSFELSGIPAGRSYLIKLFVFPVGYSFKVEDIDENFEDLVQTENPVYAAEDYTIPFANWVRSAGQPVEVKSGEAATVNISLP
jgi:hypothetical protein